ncbi:hypothetical protein FS837_003258 [Tulasnella sp. UAMH 9824]|nr:hypothetical protein FS837_003258 [Tulasnella sp. UAMH 9824]
MLPAAVVKAKKRKAAALKDSSNHVHGKRKVSNQEKPRPTAKSTAASKSSTRPHTISKIVDDVFSKATDSLVEKQRRGSTAPKSDVQDEIRRHFRPNPKAQTMDSDEISVHNEPVDEADDPESQQHATPGPVFQAVSSKLEGQTFLTESPSKSSKGKKKALASLHPTGSTSTKPASSKPRKLVRFGHIVFVPLSFESRGYGRPTIELPDSIAVSALRDVGLAIDTPAGHENLAIPLTATQSEISQFLKPRLPLVFEHLDDNEWRLLTIAKKRLADFGSKEPSGADFGTVVGAQKGGTIIDKVIYLAPRKSFPRKVIKELGLEAVIKELQRGTVPTRRSKRLSVGGPVSESESNSPANSDSDADADTDSDDDDGDGDEDDDGDDDDDDDSNGNEGDYGNGNEGDYGNGDNDSDGDGDVGGAEDEDTEQKTSADGGQDGYSMGGEDDDDSEASASVRPPRKKRRVLPERSIPAVSTPARSRRAFKGKENTASYVSSSSPSSEHNDLWFNAASYEPKMSFLNMH